MHKWIQLSLFALQCANVAFNDRSPAGFVGLGFNAGLTFCAWIHWYRSKEKL